MLAKVAAHAGAVTHPLLEAREEKRVIVVTIAGDRGLAGAFNTNVNKATAHLLASHPEWTEVRILPIGKKAVEYWKRRKYPLTEKTYSGIFATLQYANAKEIAAFLFAELPGPPRGRGVRRRQRVPVDPVAGRAHRKAAAVVPEAAAAPAGADAGVDYIYEPDVPTILAWLLPRYLEFTFYRALAESAAAEMGAKMTAMDSASKNAGDLIDKLTLTYNRARQPRITKELIEIVSGAAALE